MMPVNLSKIPLDDYPDLVSALLDGRARLYFSMVAHAQFSFLKEDGNILYSRDGIYEITYPNQVARELRARFRGTDQGGISLPTVKDSQGNKLHVIHSDEDFAPDDKGRYGITLVRFPWDCFQVELVEKQPMVRYTKATPVNLLVNDFLNENSEGARDIKQFNGWLKNTGRGKYLPDCSRYEWTTETVPEKISKSRLKSVLSELKAAERQ